MRTGTQAQSLHVHDDQDPSDKSTQVEAEAPDAADAVPSTAAPATLLDRFMQRVL
jgi:hypothetical protein